MKRIKLQPVLVLICFVFCNFTAIEEARSEELYRQAMKETLNKMDSAARADDLLQCRNQFERISMKYADEWLPVYYMAYCDIQLVYYNQKSPDNPKHLADAKERLDNLHSYPQADASEHNTLWGYYYNARLLLEPEKAQQLSAEVIRSYNQAIGENPDNPRPIVLRAFYNQFLPSFIKLKINPEEEVEKARALFGKEGKNTERPYWGGYFLDKVKN